MRIFLSWPQLKSTLNIDWDNINIIQIPDCRENRMITVHIARTLLRLLYTQLNYFE